MRARLQREFERLIVEMNSSRRVISSSFSNTGRSLAFHFPPYLSCEHYGEQEDFPTKAEAQLQHIQ
jgi:hypothetical protein